MRLPFLVAALFGLVVFAGCSSPTGPEFDPEVRPGVFQFDFETGWQGWAPIFVGIPINKEEGDDLAEVDTVSDHRSLPDGVGKNDDALFFSGSTGSAGMRLFFKRHIEGFEPGTTYRVQFDVEIASQAPVNCIGAGGSSGATRVAAAAIPVEPDRKIEKGRLVNTYVFNTAVEKALDLSGPASEPPNIGTIANGISCAEAHEMGLPWRLKRLQSGSNFWRVTADESGSVWLLVGIWTGFEGRVSLYFSEVTARFEAVDS